MGKETTSQSKKETQAPAAVRQNKALGTTEAIQDHRPESTAQRKLQAVIQGGTSESAQMKIAGSPSSPVQREIKDEDKIQGKFSLQREGLEDEEKAPA